MLMKGRMTWKFVYVTNKRWRTLAKHSAKTAARWKRIKLLAEDIEVALQDVTKETFDKQNIKAKVRDLQAK